MDQNELQDFFRRYAEASQGDAPERIAAMYDAAFLAAGPKGSAPFSNDDSFLDWLRQVRDFNRSSGMTSMRVAGLETTPIGDAFVMAHVEWAARFRQTGDEDIRFTIAYILRLSGDSPKIVAYLSLEDQQEVMQARGLL